MNGLSYGAAPFAQLADGGSGESQEREFNMFLLARLGEHELANDIVDVRQRYGAVMAQYKQQQGIELEEKLESLILVAREKEAVYKQKNDKHFEAARAHNEAEQIMEASRRTYSHYKYDVDNSNVLLTRAEKAAQQQKLETLNEKYQQAVLEESYAVTRLRDAVFARNAALADAKAASAAARDTEAQLKSSTGENNGSSVRFSTSTGFQV